MDKNKYTSFELSIFIFIILNSFTSTIIINIFKGYSISEIIIPILIYSLLNYIIISQLIKIYSDNFINNSIKNKFIKISIILVLIICSSIIAIYSLFNTSIIIKDVLLREKSLIIISLMILIIATFLASKGLKSIVIASNLLFLILVIFFIITVTFNINNIDPTNLLQSSFKIEKLNFLELTSYSIAPLFLTTIIPKNEIINFNKFSKKLKRTYILWIIYLIFKILFIISILGIKYMSILKYPEIDIFKYINIFDFINKMEEVLILNIFIENFILISLSINYNYQLLCKIKSIKNIIWTTPIIIFLILLNVNVLDNKILFISNIIFIIINLFLYDRN